MPAFPQAVKVSGTDGGLGLLGMYQLSDEADGFPKYQLMCTSRRSAKRFLSVMAYDGGRWVFSEWTGVLLNGPLAPYAGRKAGPDAFPGAYVLASGVKAERVTGPIALRVTACSLTEVAYAAAAAAQQGAAQQEQEADEQAESEDDGYMYVNRKGLCHCSQHRLENCHVCCCDHRPTNDITRAARKGRQPDVGAILERHGETQAAEHRAMLAMAALELRQSGASGGGDGASGGGGTAAAATVTMGPEEAQRLYSAAAAPPPSGDACAQCGHGGKLRRCTQCKSVRYCDSKCQRLHWPEHKATCKEIAAAAAVAAAATATAETAAAARVPAAAAAAAPTAAEGACSSGGARGSAAAAVAGVATAPRSGSDAASGSSPRPASASARPASTTPAPSAASASGGPSTHASAETGTPSSSGARRGVPVRGRSKRAASSAAAASSRPLTWAALSSVGGPASGRMLELRIVSQPIPFLRHICDAKDRAGEVRRLAFYCDGPPPAGLALGAVLRWWHPEYHYFMDGSEGARIEDEHLQYITCSTT